MADHTTLTKTEIIIEDYNSNNSVVFSNLALNEGLLQVNSFSFSIRPTETGSRLGAIIEFKKKVLGKKVQIDFQDGNGNSKHKFAGLVMEVNSTLIDDQFYEFYITGSGIFCKVNEVSETHSFYKKKLAEIIDKAFENTKVKDQVKKDPQNTHKLHYIVQYNQSLFSFISSLAIRFGEWMYYDGEFLKFGKKPDGEAIELNSPGDVFNLNIKAQAVRSPEAAVATDLFKSEAINSSTREQAPDNELLKATTQAGEAVLENPGKKIFLASGFKQEEADEKFKLEQQAIIASSVAITGTTRNNKITVGSIIKIKEEGDSSGASYIITQIQHYVSHYSSYSNSFTAVPAEVSVPPYTNPLFTVRATPQAAIVADNEDDSGLARVKVKFPWMADDEKSPWISVVVPHAGKDKGFRFLPEKDDEVLVDFLDNNAETPFVSGAVYTEKHKAGIAEAGNHTKQIGSRSGRRLEINDEEGTLYLADNFLREDPKNVLRFLRKDADLNIILESRKDQANCSVFKLDKDESLNLGVVSGGVLLAEIRLLKDGPKIEIKSQGSIDISANGNINMKGNEISLEANKINLKADDALSAEGTSKVEIKGTEVKVNADANLEAKAGASAKLEGAMLDLKGSGIANLKGGLVQIN